eukprot:Awhi_evm1s6597
MFVRETIIQNYEEKNITMDIFDQALKEAKQMMKNDCLPRFAVRMLVIDEAVDEGIGEIENEIAKGT